VGDLSLVPAAATWLLGEMLRIGAVLLQARIDDQDKLEAIVFSLTILALWYVSEIRSRDAKAPRALMYLDMATDLGAASVVVGLSTVVAIFLFHVQVIPCQQTSIWSLVAPYFGGVLILYGRRRGLAMRVQGFEAFTRFRHLECAAVLWSSLLTFSVAYVLAVQCIPPETHAQDKNACQLYAELPLRSSSSPPHS